MGLVSAAGLPPAAEYSRAADDTAPMLHAEDPAERALAARRLAIVPGAETALLCRLREEQDRSVREAILIALMEIGSPDCAAGLAELLGSEDAGLRNAAIETLAAMPEAVEPMIGNLLHDEDSDIRILTCNLLLVLPHPRAAEWLLQTAERDTHANVCAAAVDGLAEVGSAGCIPTLEALPARFPENAFLRFAVDAVIQRLQD